MDRLTTVQRIVIVVAPGLALAFVASYLTGPGPRTGWYAHAPLSGHLPQPQDTGEPGWLRRIIWLAAVSLWALTCVRVARRCPGHATPG